MAQIKRVTTTVTEYLSPDEAGLLEELDDLEKDPDEDEGDESEDDDEEEERPAPARRRSRK